MRRAAVAILVIGIAAAALYYLVESRAADSTTANFFPNADRDTDREIGLMMGTFGVMMLGWARALDDIGTQAILIAAGSAFVAFICYRIASVWDHNERVRAENVSELNRRAGDRPA